MKFKLVRKKKNERWKMSMNGGYYLLMILINWMSTTNSCTLKRQP